MKLRMVDTLATPAVTQATVTSTLANHVLMALPKKTTLARSLPHHRQRMHTSGVEAMPPILVDINIIMSVCFQDFVLFDSGPDPDRLILLGCS